MNGLRRILSHAAVAAAVLNIAAKAAEAAENRCASLFVLGGPEIRALVEELSELHFASTSAGSEAMRSWSEKRFRERFDQIARHVGTRNLQQALSNSLRRTKESAPIQSNPEEEKRKLEAPLRKSFAPIVLDELATFRPSEFPWGHGFPDASFVLQGEGLPLSRVRFIDSSTRLKSMPWKSPWPRAVNNYRWHKRGSRNMVTGLIRNPNNLWVMDERSGRSWSLPTLWEDHNSSSRDLALKYHVYDVSANGRFVVSIDRQHRVHRLDLLTGKLDTSEDIHLDAVVGIGVTNRGSVELWTRGQMVVTLNRNFKVVRQSSLKTLIGLTMPVLGVIPSPDKKQLLLLAKTKSVLFDLPSGKHVEINLGDTIQDAKWYSEQIWLQVVNAPYARISRDLSSFEERSSLKPWIWVNSNRFVAQLFRFQDLLEIVDLQTGKSSKIPVPTGSLSGLKGPFWAAVSPSGERIAVYPDPNFEGREIYFFNSLGEAIGKHSFTDERSFKGVQFSPDDDGVSILRYSSDGGTEVSFWHIRNTD